MERCACSCCEIRQTLIMTQQTLLRELVSAFAKLVQLTGFSQEAKRRKNLERFTNLRVILVIKSDSMLEPSWNNVGTSLVQ